MIVASECTYTKIMTRSRCFAVCFILIYWRVSKGRRVILEFGSVLTQSYLARLPRSYHPSHPLDDFVLPSRFSSLRRGQFETRQLSEPRESASRTNVQGPLTLTPAEVEKSSW